MINKKALVIGYGSIGNRHVNILKSNNTITDVSILSDQKGLPFKTINNLDAIQKIDPDYIVIASETSSHFKVLNYLEENFNNKIVLVEKPLFESFHNLAVKNNNVFVGYNLRFHPLIQFVREKVADKVPWSINVTCNTYLPDWRPDRDYRLTSSSKIKSGGGVLLDLSHELDYVQWFCGSIKLEYVFYDKVSDLEIETNDLLILVGRNKDDVIIQITLDYFTRLPRRQIKIEGEGICIQADLITNKLVIIENGNSSDYSWPDLDRNFTYEAEHNSLLLGKNTNACTYDEGLLTMKLIDTIKNWKTN